jgi:hypothetical protein
VVRAFSPPAFGSDVATKVKLIAAQESCEQGAATVLNTDSLTCANVLAVLITHAGHELPQLSRQVLDSEWQLQMSQCRSRRPGAAAAPPTRSFRARRLLSRVAPGGRGTRASVTRIVRGPLCTSVGALVAHVHWQRPLVHTLTCTVCVYTAPRKRACARLT